MRPVCLAVVVVSLACVLGCGKKDMPTAKPGHARVPRAGEVTTNPKDGAQMVWIPGGEFIMGADGDNDTEKPKRRVYLDGYWIYKHEVTVAQYRKFCRETGHKMPEELRWGWIDDHPIVFMIYKDQMDGASRAWEDAASYAKWAGVALPTEARWEKAARGADGRRFPWGNQWPPPPRSGNFADAACKRKHAAFGNVPGGYDDGYPDTAPVGTYPEGVSPYGCADMAGNVWEWCSDNYDSGYYKVAPARNPPGPARGEEIMAWDGVKLRFVNTKHSMHVIRGGSFFEGSPIHFRCTYRSVYDPPCRFVGFRCVKTP